MSNSKHPLTKESLQNGSIECFLDGENLSVFDYDRKNALLFSQGDWRLIRRDLLLANVDELSIQALEEQGPCAELIRAFRIRRELIHYKKVCLHLFEEARAIERELKQAMSFFFWNDGNNAEEGARAHMEAIMALLPADTNTGTNTNTNSVSEISPLDLEAVKTAMIRHGGHAMHGRETEDEDIFREPLLMDRKLMYTLASGTWAYHKGVMRALQDARDVAKAICLSPRHPDGESNGDRPLKLCNLPSSMQVEQAVNRAEREDPLDLSRRNKKYRETEVNENELTPPPKNDNDAATSAKYHVETDEQKGSTKGMAAFNRILEKVRNELGWTEDAVNFLSLSIASRGGFKALAIVEELCLYNYHLSSLPDRIDKVLKQYRDVHKNAMEELQICQKKVENHVVTDNDLSAAVLRLKEIHLLDGSFKGCRENAKWISVISSLVFHSTDSNENKSKRLFVAGDDSVSNGSFVPKGFQLGTFVASSRSLLDKVLIPTMRHTLKKESWPPAFGSQRSRILAFNEITIQDAKIGKKKLQQCSHCCGFFDSRWIRYQICSICESLKRDQSDEKRCLFVSCKTGAEAFCSHHRRCFVCDAPHSCLECRFSTGDGEVVAAMVETMQPKLLLLDFDRTLCSTKSGASPLPKVSNNSKRQHSKEGYSHSIDPELKAAVLAQQTHGDSYVVTRNSHKAEIETFLGMHGLRDLAQNVHVVPKKTTKGEYIEGVISANKCDDSILFVDDGIRELTASSWLRTTPNVHRLLYRRY